MNMMLKILKLTPLAALLLLLVLLLQAAFFTSQSATYTMGSDGPDKVQLSLGAGSPITITTIDGVTDRDINWLTLVTNLLLSYAFAAAMASGVTRAGRFRRPGTTFGIAILIIVAVAFVASIGLSKAYWGYFFSRPPPLKEIHDVASVTAIVPVTTKMETNGTQRIVVQADFSIADQVAHGRDDTYYCLAERLLLVLDDADLLPEMHVSELRALPALFPLIRESGILATPEEGYDASDLLRGIVLDTLNTSGKRIVFVAVTGRQLSNDHYPYYEMVFTGTTGSSELAYLRGQRFFYDVAGIEGTEWYAGWLFFSLLGTVIILPVFVTVVFIRRLTRRA